MNLSVFSSFFNLICRTRRALRAVCGAWLLVFCLALSVLGVQWLGLVHAALHPVAHAGKLVEFDARFSAPLVKPPLASSVDAAQVSWLEVLVAHPDAPMGAKACQLFDAAFMHLGMAVFAAVFLRVACGFLWFSATPWRVFTQCRVAYLARAPPL